MIRRPPRSTQSRSSAASDVYKRQVRGAHDPARGRSGPRGPDRHRGRRGARAGEHRVSGGTWFGVVRTASGGILRHKVQAVVIAAVLLVATASATLGLALLAAGDGPFTHAFAAQRGADVTFTVNAAHATGAELAATRHVSVSY